MEKVQPAEAQAYAQLLECSPAPHFAVNRDGTIAYLNRAGAALLGEDPARSLGTLLATSVSAADRPTFDAFLSHSLADQPQTCSVRLRRRSAFPVSVRLSARYLPQSEQCLIVAMDPPEGDGSPPEWSGDAILKVLNEQTSLKICVKDREGKVRFLNQAMARFLGKSPEEVLGTCDLDLVSDPEQAAQIRANDLQIMTTGATECFEESGTSAAGPWTYLFTKSPYLDNKGDAAGVIGLGLDITARKREEAQLRLESRASEEKFSAVFRVAPVAISLLTLPGGVLQDVNPAWLALTGYASKEEVIGKTTVELGVIHDLARDRIIGEFSRHDCVINAEQTLRTKSGELRSVLVSVEPVIIHGNRYALSVAKDITLQKQIEQELREHRNRLDALVKERTAELEARNEQLILEIAERRKAEADLVLSEQRYRAIVETQSVFVDRYLPGGILTFVNPALAELVGGDAERLLGTSFFPFIHPDDVGNLRRIIEGLSPEHPDAEEENRVILPDGVHWHSWHHRAFFDDAGNVVEYQSTGKDITALKELERSLRESEARYRSVVEDQTELITRYLPDGRYTFVNEAFCRFFDKTPEDVIGTQWFPDAVSDDLPLIEAKLALLCPENPTVVIENRVHSGRGEIHWMQFVNRGIFDASGRLVETQTVGRDITARKEAEAALKRYAQRLIVVEDDLRKRIAMELHDDVGQELTALSLNLVSIASGLGTDAESASLEPLEDSRRLTRAIHRTVRNMMVSLHPNQLEDFGLVTALRTHARKFLERTGIAVTVQAPSDFPRLDAAKEMALFRIAQEALNNVRKHANASAVSVTCAVDGPCYRFCITDDGDGLPSHGSLSRTSEPGWGLTIMRERAELIGGRFHIVTAPGRGTSITIEF